MQPEDYLTQILETKEAWSRMREKEPWALKAGYHPRHVHSMLEWAVNKKLVKATVDTFSVTYSIWDILFNIVHNECAVCVNGRFTDYGHIVTVVGFETKQKAIFNVKSPEEIKLFDVEYIIIDDPYGNYHTGYGDVKGNGIRFDIHSFDDLTRQYNNPNNKWAHMFSRKV
jgi:hypothetical protein